MNRETFALSQKELQRVAVISRCVRGELADPVLPTEFLHRLFAQIVLKNKSQLFFHYTARFPWHTRSLCEALAISSQCQESSRSVLSGMRPVRTNHKTAPLPFFS